MSAGTTGDAARAVLAGDETTRGPLTRALVAADRARAALGARDDAVRESIAAGATLAECAAAAGLSIAGVAKIRDRGRGA